MFASEIPDAVDAAAWLNFTSLPTIKGVDQSSKPCCAFKSFVSPNSKEHMGLVISLGSLMLKRCILSSKFVLQLPNPATLACHKCHLCLPTSRLPESGRSGPPASGL